VKYDQLVVDHHHSIEVGGYGDCPEEIGIILLDAPCAGSLLTVGTNFFERFSKTSTLNLFLRWGKLPEWDHLTGKIGHPFDFRRTADIGALAIRSCEKVFQAPSRLDLAKHRLKVAVKLVNRLIPEDCGLAALGQRTSDDSHSDSPIQRRIEICDLLRAQF